MNAYIFVIKTIFLVLLLNTCSCFNSDEDEKDKRMADSFFKFAENIIPGAAKILDGFLSSPFLNECQFSCPNKKIPRQNPKHISDPNGCGSYGMQFDFEQLDAMGFTDCCNIHDTCYDTCINDKNDCDREFKKCLFNKCKILKKTFSFQPKVGEIFEETARLGYLAVQKFGCLAYGKSQKLSCLC